MSKPKDTSVKCPVNSCGITFKTKKAMIEHREEVHLIGNDKKRDG